MEKEFLNVNDVVELCNVKEGKAYQIIRLVNKEMKKNGYITINERVNRSYLFKKLGLERGNNNASL